MASGSSSSSSSAAAANQPPNGEKEEIVFYKNRGWKSSLLLPQHVKYCRRLLFQPLSSDFQDYDTQRINFLHFMVAALDILQATSSALKDEDRLRIINWIYLLQVTDNNDHGGHGFRGSSTFVSVVCPETSLRPSGHITMTFAALISLLSLRDDLSRVNKKAIIAGIGKLQNKDGSFRASLDCSENDMRFVYSAVATCYILDDFSSINVPKLLSYIQKSFTYEGSCGSGYGTEGHAAYTFCAVASLVLLEKLETTLSAKQLEVLTRWLLFRQDQGFTGRPNKDQDTCYSFWVCATLALLGKLDLSSKTENMEFIFSNQNPLTGGIGKYDNDLCDPLHTFMGIAGLSLLPYANLNPVLPELTMTQSTWSHLRTLHENWQSS
jgi:geranylgeranyl transferase type-1 subunit beta